MVASVFSPERLIVETDNRWKPAGPMDGNYRIEIQAPLGSMQGDMTVSVCGRSLVGAVSTNELTAPIVDGTIDGDVVRWLLHLEEPMALTMAFEGVVKPYGAEGLVSMGAFGCVPFIVARVV